MESNVFEASLQTALFLSAHIKIFRVCRIRDLLTNSYLIFHNCWFINLASCLTKLFVWISGTSGYNSKLIISLRYTTKQDQGDKSLYKVLLKYKFGKNATKKVDTYSIDNHN